MAKKTTTKTQPTYSFTAIIAGIVGALVSLSVGAGMANSILTLEPIIPAIITAVAGWIVIVGTILSIVMALFGK